MSVKSTTQKYPISSTFTAGNDATLSIRSGSATQYSKISMGTNTNKGTIGCPGSSGTFFTDTAQGDLVLRADDNNSKIHIGAGTSGPAAMVITEVANVGKVGIGTVSPTAQLDIQDTTTGSASTGGHLRLSANDGAAMGDSHRLGVIEFTGAEDAGGSQTVGARIEAMTDAAWSGSENGGALYFYTTDGDASQSNTLKLDSNKKATFSGNVVTDGSVSLKEKAAAIADTAAYGQVWTKTATPNQLYFTTDAGDDIQITSGTGLAVPSGLIVDGGNSESAAVTIGTNDANALNFETNGATRITITSAGEVQIPTGLDLALIDSNELQFKDASGAYYSYMMYGAETTALADEFIMHVGSGSGGAGEIGFKTQGAYNNFLYLDPCPACAQNYFALRCVGGGNDAVELRAIRKHAVSSTFGEVRLTAEGTNVSFGAVSAQLSVKGDHGITSAGAWHDKTTALSSTTTLDETHRRVTVDATSGAVSINLPAVSGITGRVYDIIKIDSSGNAVTVDGNSSETINGATTFVLSDRYDKVQVSAGASEWHIWVGPPNAT
jgi:hypothetical protein